MGGGWEWDSRERKALASVRGWGRLCYDMEIPACWSCSPVGLWVAVRPWSLATSYLALVAARIQGMNLSLTPLPATNQIPWERWGVTQRMLLSPCPLPFCLSLLFLSFINPQYFPLVSARNQTPPPPITASWTCELEELGLFICLPCVLLKISSLASLPWKKLSKWLLMLRAH